MTKSNLKHQTKDLAVFTKQLAEDAQRELNKLHKLIDQTNEVLGATVRLLGQEAVEQALSDMRQEANDRLLAQQKEGVKYLVDNKVLVPAEVIVSPDGYVVGTDKLANGEEHRVHFEISGLNPQFLPLYVGKKVGDKVEANGAVLTIDEVYTLDHKKYDELMAAQAAAAAAPVPAAPAPEPTTQVPVTPEAVSASPVV